METHIYKKGMKTARNVKIWVNRKELFACFKFLKI